MGWEVEEDGLKALFSQSIPTLVANDFSAILTEFLRKHDIELEDIDAFACHPGGAKVLDALEDAFRIERGALKESRSVLRDFGNMSAVTALFVLERMDWRKKKQRILMTALGPGFSSTFLMLEG
jgi:alkylresorcinol/alkylpyrone synthase